MAERRRLTEDEEARLVAQMKRRAALARKLRVVSAEYKYRTGAWAAMSDVAIEHCRENEHAAIRSAVAPVIAVLERSSVWAVRCANYEPAEIDSLWASEELARKRCSELSDMWCVEPMEVNGDSTALDMLRKLGDGT